MCGIIGSIARHHVANDLLEGLQRLEYRGYDSAGIAIHNQQSHIERKRAEGKVAQLLAVCAESELKGGLGLAHTRWATHGKPSDSNAHPHCAGGTVIVHNGIIENHEALRARLESKGHSFNSETDSEVVAHLIEEAYKKHGNLLEATERTIKSLHGAFSLGVMHTNEPETLIAVRQGSPLVVGFRPDGHSLSSDIVALNKDTTHYIALEDGDVVALNYDNVFLKNNGASVEREKRSLTGTHLAADRMGYRHFMLKEIYEQPSVLNDALEGRLAPHDITLDDLTEAQLRDIQHIQIAACGTSYHAGMVAKYWIESIAKIPCQVEIASELRYRSPVVQPNTLFVAISQSGETADTLAAVQQAKQADHPRYQRTLAICNVANSDLVRICDHHLLTRAGIEMGVASTKAFTTQLAVLLQLTLLLAKAHQQLNASDEERHLKALRHLPIAAEQMLKLNDRIAALATRFGDKQHALFLGRGIHYPVALEGALKLKEISYIHAEAYPSGELKHGPLALVDQHMPIVAVAPNNPLLTKLYGNLQEVKARGGVLMVFADEAIQWAHPDIEMIHMPTVDDLISPIVHTIPLQLLAYHVAVLKGTDVDQPRNLAKSVTVE